MENSTSKWSGRLRQYFTVPTNRLLFLEDFYSVFHITLTNGAVEGTRVGEVTIDGPWSVSVFQLGASVGNTQEEFSLTSQEKARRPKALSITAAQIPESHAPQEFDFRTMTSTSVSDQISQSPARERPWLNQWIAGEAAGRRITPPSPVQVLPGEIL
jgi:hypothetical protein